MSRRRADLHRWQIFRFADPDDPDGFLRVGWDAGSLAGIHRLLAQLIKNRPKRPRLFRRVDLEVRLTHFLGQDTNVVLAEHGR